MARRSTAPSMWLPGFDPDEPPTLPELATLIAVPTVEAALAECIEATQTETAEPAVVARASWRTTSQVVEAAPRILWPRLTSAGRLYPVGAVAKFEANLVAIDTLQRIDNENRIPCAEERQALQRYTGWGGLPASFNLDTDEPAWAERARRLQKLLSAEDYASARASVNNSHYTEIHVIEAMWQAIRGFGFTGGRVLEPAAGIGHFIGAMPEDLAWRSTVAAIEIDRLSGRILQALYGVAGVDARVAPFEKTPLPENWFDLVIGNVPFGKYQVADQSNRAYAHYSIHNYFLGRAIDLVRPGGLVCLITSSHTMESRQETVRQYLASQAHLLGAIRLPKGAFAGIAATEVQTDILFLRKRQGSETVEAEWLDITAVPNELRHPLAPANRYLPINEWYMRHPEFCIGRIRSESNGYEEVPTAVFEGDLEKALRERIALLPTGVFEPVKHATAPLRVVVPVEAGARPGSFRLHQGRVHRVEGGELVDVHDQLNATQRGRITGMGAIRDHAGPCSMPSWPMRTMVR